MLARKSSFYTPAEYLAFEEKAETKSEYYDGEIMAMAGISLNHNRIAGNIHTTLNVALRDKPCETFMGDIRVWIEQRRFYVYPDVMVICGQPKFVKGRTDTITNPQVIIEVLSESTEKYDRTEKFQAYWMLDSLAEYILIDQYRLRVDYFRQLNERDWLLRVLTKPEDRLTLESIGLEIPLSDIYRNVAWEEENP
jgi:Uma2 family endonuclease